MKGALILSYPASLWRNHQLQQWATARDDCRDRIQLTESLSDLQVHVRIAGASDSRFLAVPWGDLGRTITVRPVSTILDGVVCINPFMNVSSVQVLENISVYTHSVKSRLGVKRVRLRSHLYTPRDDNKITS